MGWLLLELKKKIAIKGSIKQVKKVHFFLKDQAKEGSASLKGLTYSPPPFLTVWQNTPWKGSKEKYGETQLPVLVNHLQVFKNILFSQIPSMTWVLYLCLSCSINIMKCLMPFFHSGKKCPRERENIHANYKLVDKLLWLLPGCSALMEYQTDGTAAGSVVPENLQLMSFDLDKSPLVPLIF